jgi:hypothetical protein
MTSSIDIRLANKRLAQIENLLNNKFSSVVNDPNKPALRVTGSLELFNDVTADQTLSGTEFENLQDFISELKRVLPSITPAPGTDLYTALAANPAINSFGLNKDQIKSVVEQTMPNLRAQLRGTTTGINSSKGLSLAGITIKSKDDLKAKIQSFRDYLETNPTNMPVVSVLKSDRYQTAATPPVFDIELLKDDMDKLLANVNGATDFELTKNYLFSKKIAGVIGTASTDKASDREIELLELALKGVKLLDQLVKETEKKKAAAFRDAITQGLIPILNLPYSQADMNSLYRLIELDDKPTFDLAKLELFDLNFESDMANFGTQYTIATGATSNTERDRFNRVMQNLYASKNLEAGTDNDLSNTYVIDNLGGTDTTTYQARKSWTTAQVQERATVGGLQLLAPIFFALNDTRAPFTGPGDEVRTGLSYKTTSLIPATGAAREAAITTELDFYLSLLNKGLKQADVMTAYNFIRLASSTTDLAERKAQVLANLKPD